MTKHIDTPLFATLNSSKEKHLVSFYQNNYSNIPSDNIPFYNFCKGVETGEWENNVDTLQAETNEDEQIRLKKKLPCITTSGIFPDGSRNNSSLVKHSNLLQVDIDVKKTENPHLFDRSNLDALRKELENDPYTLACFTSPRGKGLKVIIKIDGKQHRDSFYSAESYYEEKYSVVIDGSCKNESRLMNVSYDPNIYVNWDSIDFPVTYKKPVPAITRKPKTSGITGLEETRTKIECITTEIEKGRIDITGNRAQWMKIAFALISDLKADARDYFHRVSQFSEKYDSIKCDKGFDAFLKSTETYTGRPITIYTFYHFAEEKEICDSNGNIKLNGKSPSQKTTEI